jgi:cytochrome c-type protein NapC
VTRVDVLIAFIIVCAALAAIVALRSELTRARGGKILAFVGLFLLPALSLWAGFDTQMERAQSTTFCLSCHVMSDYGRSLLVDDPSYVPAMHFQNNLVPRDHACYTCHTNYAMFGGIRAKIHGARHVYVQYFGKVPLPDQIKLYEPFNNRECLHCHGGARKFEQVSGHTKTPDLLGTIISGQRSCTSSRCHDTIHDVGSLADVKFWKASNP